MEPLIVGRSPFAERLPSPITGITWIKPELVCHDQIQQLDRPIDVSALLCFWACATMCCRAAGGIARNAADPPESTGTTSNEASSRIDGHTLKFTNLKKVYYPDDGYTKRDLLNYYDAVAELILPHLKDRPLSLKRYPNGIEAEYFFQKNMPANQASWLRKVKIWSEHTNRSAAAHPLCLCRRPRQPALSHQPGLHRPEPLDEPR